MKYCLSGRQPMSILKKCDEIRMRFQDIEKLIDYAREIPNKTYIIDIPKTVLPEDINWRLLEAFQETSTIILCIENLDLVDSCRKHNIKFYWAYKAITYYELRSLLALGVCYVDIGAPLCFDLENVRAIVHDTPLRMTVNNAVTHHLGGYRSLESQWVRPEDQDIYDKYIDAFDFYTNHDLTKEATLYHIYAENKKWPGNLKMLIDGLDCNIDNTCLPFDFGTVRAKCKQRCMERGTCHYCANAILFSQKLPQYFLES